MRPSEMTEEELIELALYWDDFLSRYGVAVYVEVRYGVGVSNDNPELRVSREPTVD